MFWVLGFGFPVQSCRFRDQGLGFRAQSFGCLFFDLREQGSATIQISKNVHATLKFHILHSLVRECL